MRDKVIRDMELSGYIKTICDAVDIDDCCGYCDVADKRETPEALLAEALEVLGKFPTDWQDTPPRTYRSWWEERAMPAAEMIDAFLSAQREAP